MNRHWQSAKLFKWMRKKIFKIEKPNALGWGEWDEWDANTKKEKPIGYFVTEVLPDWLEKVPETLIDPFDNVRIKIINYVAGTHRLDSNLEKGKWHEFEERMLHANFDSFVDFIEIEEASHHIAWRKDEDVKKYSIPWYHRNRWIEWGQQFRCPQAAIDHLTWEMTLDQEDPTDPNHMPSPHQAIAAREKMYLYTWWTKMRPNRGSAWDASGFQKFWDDMDAKYGVDGSHSWIGLGRKQVLTPAEQRMYDKLSKAADDLEEQWYKEDEDMLIRLVKLRRSLWT